MAHHQAAATSTEGEKISFYVKGPGGSAGQRVKVIASSNIFERFLFLNRLGIFACSVHVRAAYCTAYSIRTDMPTKFLF